jgi:hypothetical protein
MTKTSRRRVLGRHGEPGHLGGREPPANLSVGRSWPGLMQLGHDPREDEQNGPIPRAGDADAVSPLEDTAVRSGTEGLVRGAVFDERVDVPPTATARE